MKFSILTILPDTVRAFLSEGLLGKAIERGLISTEVIQIRDFADPPHFRTDDRPYGGGAGMVMKPEPIVRALRAAKVGIPSEKTRSILLSAKGEPFTQEVARRLEKNYDHLIFICGRYEGVDERVADYYADEELRIGDYVLMGGEVAACAIIEAVARLKEGVLGNSESPVEESFSDEVTREYDQYTRPPSFEDREVPEVLRGGDHQAIRNWRKKSSA